MPVHFPAGPWFRTVFNFSGGERPWMNEVWWKISGSVPGSTNIVTCAAAFDSMFSAVILPVLATNVFYDGVDCYLNNGTYTVAAHTFPGTSGTGVDVSLPNEDAAVGTLNAGVGTRKGRGRIFFGGVDRSGVSDSIIAPAQITLYQAVLTAMKAVTSIGGVTCALAVWSRSLTALEPVVFTAMNPVLGHRTKRRPRR